MMDSLSEFDAVDAETRQVMQSRVNTSVRRNYETQNVKFIGKDKSQDFFGAQDVRRFDRVPSQVPQRAPSS